MRDRENKRSYTLDDIVAAVARVGRVHEEVLCGTSRQQYLVTLRWVVARIARCDGYTTTDAAARLGGKDCATMLHGLVASEKMIQEGTRRGRQIVEIETAALNLLGGETVFHDVIEVPPPPTAPDAKRLPRVVDGGSVCRVVTNSGYINSNGEIILWHN